MAEVVAGLVEQHFPQSTADDDPQHAVEQQVVDLLGVPAQFRAAPRMLPPQDDEEDEGGQVHEAVPAHGHGTDGDGDRVELGMDQHSRSITRTGA